MTQRGHGDKLGRKQEAALVALLEEPTVTAAAVRVGIHEKTLRTWLRESGFRAAYRAACRRVLECSIGRLQRTTDKAADALERALGCGNPAVEVKAALGLLQVVAKLTEQLDILPRLEAIEKAIQEGTRCARETGA